MLRCAFIRGSIGPTKALRVQTNQANVASSAALRHALTGLGSFLVAAVAFFSLADRLGVWPVGAAWAGAASVLVFIVLYVVVSRVLSLQQKSPTPPESASKKVLAKPEPVKPDNAAQVMTPRETLELGNKIALEGLTPVVRPPFAREIERARWKQAEKPKRGPVCEPGPYEVSYGKPARVELDVSKGDKITGRLEETDGYEFDWFIVNEDNLVKHLRDKRFEKEAKGSGDHIYQISWEVPDKGPWILVLETTGTQVIREVEVHLRREND